MKELWNNAVKFWRELGTSERAIFAGGAAGIVVLVGLLAYWTFRTDYQVLFSDLESRDAAAIVQELKRMKVLYRVDDGGARILVEEELVYETRLGLMGRGVPLSGGVGFEIFDNKDVGMTEYTQKINYQRALQGELARTVMAIEQVRQARVHLVVTESGLFKRQKAQPKASVNLTLKSGAQLNHEQIAGIQRLVAAAVPGLDVGRVTVSDQRGVTLSPTMESNEELATATGHLHLKKQAEDYLARKVVDVMDRTFGPGQAIVSVDATLNFDEIRRTQESLAPYHSSEGVTGAIVRKRQSVHQQARGPATRVVNGDADYAAGTSPVTSTTEVEYQIGKTIEQVVSQPGGLKRISVGVVVPAQLDNEQLARVREVVSMVVGFSSDRGDAITIQPIDRLLTKVAEPVDNTEPEKQEESRVLPTWLMQPQGWMWLAGGIATLLIVAVAVLMRRRNESPVSLGRDEREQLLAEIRQWLETNKASGDDARGAA